MAIPILDCSPIQDANVAMVSKLFNYCSLINMTTPVSSALELPASSPSLPKTLLCCSYICGHSASAFLWRLEQILQNIPKRVPFELHTILNHNS